jgi:hypothetical protein
MALAVAALSAKFGGAAGEDAKSLNGQARGAKEAFGELQETFGSFIASVGSKTGALEAVTKALRDMTSGMELASKMSLRSLISQAGQDGMMSKTLGTASGGLLLPSTMLADALMAGSKETQDKANAEKAALVWKELQDEESNKKAIASNGGVNDFSAFEMDLTGGKKGGGAGAGGGGGVMDFSRSEMDLRPVQEFDLNDVINTDSKARERRFEEEAKAQAAGLKKHFDEMERMASAAAKTLAAQQQQFAKAGADIGAAFVNSISGALESLASGGEQDAGKILASILAGVLSTVGSVVGNLLLPGIGGALGGAIGGLAGAGVRAAANGPSVTVNTFDSRSTREFFENDGGRGFYNAQRTGRGQGGR